MMYNLVEVLFPGTTVIDKVAIGNDDSGVVGFFLSFEGAMIDMTLTNSGGNLTFTLDVIKAGRKSVMVTVRYQCGWYTLDVRTPKMSTLRKFRYTHDLPWEVIGSEIVKAISEA
jgi:hypothetical protein